MWLPMKALTKIKNANINTKETKFFNSFFCDDLTNCSSSVFSAKDQKMSVCTEKRPKRLPKADLREPFQEHIFSVYIVPSSLDYGVRKRGKVKRPSKTSTSFSLY